MAMTAAERKRQQIAREKAEARKQLDVVYGMDLPYLSAWMEEHQDAELSHFKLCFDGMNMTPPDLTGAHDPISQSGDFVFPADDEGKPSYRGALGRAELDVELLLEAAKTLATMINAYKRDVILARLKSLEADLDDPEPRSLKLSAIVELNKALERLGKSVWTCSGFVPVF